MCWWDCSPRDIVRPGHDTPAIPLGHTGKKNEFDAVIHMQEAAHKKSMSASQAVLLRMRVTLHATRQIPHGASRLTCSVPAS